jgi:hypothetical protein
MVREKEAAVVTECFNKMGGGGEAAQWQVGVPTWRRGRVACGHTR